MTNLRWKQGVSHAYYYDARKFGGSYVPIESPAPSTNVQGCFQNPNQRDIAFCQIIDDTYRTITYNAFEHIMKSGMGTVSGGERNEGTYNSGRISEGNTVRYTCYHKIPTGWTDDFPSNRFMLFQQWHNQADGGSPPHVLGYGRIGSQYLLQPTFFNTPSVDVSEFIELFIDKWVRVDTVIKWSSGSDGSMNVYRNGVLKFSRTGQSMNSGDLPYWKFGMYRDAAINLDNSVWTKYISQTIL